MIEADIFAAPAVTSLDPHPLTTDWYTAPFWEAAADRRLVCARCASCGTFRMPPSPRCGTCSSATIEWVEQGGIAELYTYTVVHRVLPESGRESPFVIAVVRLPEADSVKMVTSVIAADPTCLRVGMNVELAWRSVDGVTVPVFTCPTDAAPSLDDHHATQPERNLT